MQRLFQYLKDTRAELAHVSWPTRQQAVLYTILVVALSLVVAGFLWVFDRLFGDILKALI